jgi:hypothetical protein
VTHFMPGLLWMRSASCSVLSPCRTCASLTEALSPVCLGSPRTGSSVAQASEVQEGGWESQGGGRTRM